jgi:RNA polymerase sigma-70 factor (ECF subfamily)
MAVSVDLIGESAAAFDELTNPFRRQLLVHCYRMLGSIDDAEDAVQDTLVRAWKGRATFQRAGSLRAWLYRIATNVCLDAIGRRKRVQASSESLDIGPIPDEMLDEPSAGPEARYDALESISLAFLTALQLLPPRQRAVLILRDVLAWQATEVAELLDLTVPAVNSVLHRARTTISSAYATAGDGPRAARPVVAEPSGLRAVLERYVRAWETADVAGLVALLRDDAVVSMPPAVFLTGPAMIRAFLTDSVLVGGTRVRMVPVGANRMPAFAIYSGSPSEAVVRPYAVVLLDVDGPLIARMSVFADPRLVARFRLPASIEG